jgi:shikimate kinase
VSDPSGGLGEGSGSHKSPRQIVIVGLMGSGKTTVGKLLAARLGRPFRDSDDGIQERTGRTVRDLQHELGDDRMHEIEAEQLLDDLGRPDPLVIGAAASTVESDACRAALVASDAVTVWLDGSPELLASRFDSSRHRPTFGSDVVAFLRDQSRRRAPMFASLHPIRVQIDGKDPEQIVDEILRELLR